jgi:uncharacterized integral membrane protein
MSILHRTVRETNGQPQSADAGTSAPTEQLTPPQQPQPATVSPGRVPRTRTGAAWVALIAAALLAVLLIVFLVQNTHSTEISFLWMTTSTPLAVALLIAAVGSVLLTLIVGTARISQLRRLVRKNRTR